jgi:hypothetical protein
MDVTFLSILPVTDDARPSERTAGYDDTGYTCLHPKVLTTLEHDRHAKRSESRRTGIRKYKSFFHFAARLAS